MAQTFHQFPDFPMELRLKIWREHLRTPRTIRPVPHDDNRFLLKWKDDNCNIPGLLGVNQESRREGLKYYNRYFKWKSLLVPRLERSGYFDTTSIFGGIFLNPDFDTICCPAWTGTCIIRHHREDFATIKYLEIDLEHMSVRKTLNWRILYSSLVPASMPRLREFSVLLNMDDDSSGRRLKRSDFQRILKDQRKYFVTGHEPKISLLCRTTRRLLAAWSPTEDDSKDRVGSEVKR